MPEQSDVLVADDEPVIRAGLSAILNSQSDLTVTGTADDGEEAVDACARPRPDVLLPGGQRVVDVLVQVER